VIDDEIAEARDRVVVLHAGAVAAWCPFASTSPLLMRVCNTDADTTFDNATDDEVAATAVATRDALAAIGRAVEHVPYNVVVHTTPRWYVEITPRLSLLAGFEQATGVFVNTIPPERAVTFLGASPE
jgi:UDPglucose--hexose-1-phosphate uridylyltransferase